MQRDKLRGLIYERYPAMAAAAEACGVSKQKMHRIVSGKKYSMDTDEIMALAAGLSVPAEELLRMEIAYIGRRDQC